LTWRLDPHNRRTGRQHKKHDDHMFR
jgi:hypothetical protein